MFGELKKSLLQAIRKQARTLGCDVRRANAANVWELRIPRLLNDRGIRTVLDVGANEGQYARILLDHGFKGSILSFEALPEACSRLQNQTTAFNGRWIAAEPMALSDANGEATFYEAGNSVSSSLLPMSKSHLDAAPESATVQQIKVRTMRLDDYLAEHPIQPPAFLKLDVQGGESLVLRGATSAMRNLIAGIQLEMSLTSLYDGQQLYWEIDEFLRREGFECCDIITEFRDPDNLRLLQFDGVYFRKNLQLS